MSNYIIAGEAGSQDLADCEFLGSKLVASTPSTSIHIIAKHHTEWDEFLKKTCSGYGFKEPSNPIIFTVEGKLIGDKSSFKQHVLESYSVRGELDKNLRGLISEYDKVSLENFRQKEADGPTVIETIRDRIDEIVKSGGMRIADGFFQECIDNAFEFSVKISQILGPFTYDSFDIWGENLDFIPVAELASEKAEEDVLSNRELKVTEEDFAENEEDSKNGDFLSESGKPKELEKPPVLESPLITNEESDPDFSLRNYEVDDKNIKKFIELFTKANFVDNTEAQAEVTEIPVPTSIKTLKIFKSNIVKDLPRDYTLALSPFPLIPRELIVFSGKMVEGGWLLRDCSMMQNWLKVINIPPQRPVYKDGDILDPIIPKEPVFVKDISGSCLKYRGYTTQQLSLDLECSRNSSLKLNTINIMIRHILTECDWEIWYKTIKELNAIGYYQLLPYGETNYQPLRSGQMLISLLPIKGTSLVSFEELFEKYKKDDDFFTIEEYNFDHIILHLGKSANSRVISEGYLKSIEMLKIVHKSIGKKYLECGLNIILKGNFLMVVPIYRPYASTFGRNLYPGPLWACGIVNLPEIPKQWPETVGDYKLRTPFRLLETSCKYHID